MSLFSTNFSFAAPSSRPDHLYPLSAPTSDISPTSSRANSPSSPTSTVPSSVSSSTDDLFALTSTLSASTLYPSSTISHFHPGVPQTCGSGRRSPPRSTPFTLPPNSTCSSSISQPSSDLLARRERRQAYVQDQLSMQSRRKLSLLVARMLGDEAARKHPHDGLHPSNVRVVAAMPGSVRRNPLAELRRSASSDEEGEEMMDEDSSEIVESIEGDRGVGRESANRVSKRRSGGRAPRARR